MNKLLQKCEKYSIKNIFCTKMDAYWAFQLLFKDNSIKRIVMNYPDPWFKRSHEEKRLTKKENFYIFAKKLTPYGEIKIRTDDYSFVNFTLQECYKVESFSVNISTPAIDEPLTKYEKRWISMGKSIWEMVLIKEKDPTPIKINEIREVKEVFPVRIEKSNLNIQDLSNREFKIEDGLYLKCFSIWKRDEDYGIEALLSENGFLQAFLIIIKKKEGYFIMDVSQFSEIFKTEGIKKSMKFLSKILEKEML